MSYVPIINTILIFCRKWKKTNPGWNDFLIIPFTIHFKLKFQMNLICPREVIKPMNLEYKILN